MMIVQSTPSMGREHLALRDIGALLRRRAVWLALLATTGLGLGAALYARQPRLYRAEAVLALDVRRIQGMPIDQVVTPLPPENPVLRTELDRIGSRIMARRVLAKLAEEGVDPFPLSATGPAAKRLDAAETQGSETGGVPTARPRSQSSGISAADKMAAALEDRLRSGLKVVNDGHSYTIYIAYTAEDPGVAARVANSYSQAYLDYQDDVQMEATRRVSDWLSDRLKVLAARLERSEQVAERFRASSGLQEIDGVTLAAQQLSALNAELIAARAAHATAEAREKTAARLAADSNGLDSFSEVLGSPIIQQLRASQAQFERRLRVLKDTGIAQSPEIPALQAELEAVRRQIDQEVEHILASLRNEIDAAARRVASLEEELRIAQANYGALDLARVKLDALTREANADRAVYESLLGRSKQIVDQNGLVDPGVRLISEATAPSRPFGLRLGPALALGLLGGVAGGLGLAFILERLDDRVRSRRAIEAATGVAVLGSLPILPWRVRRRTAGIWAQPPGHAFAEAIASLQWMLRLAPATRRSATFVVTSAVPGEGKTTAALALARSVALAGRSVVLVDADPYRQGLSRMALPRRHRSDPMNGLDAYFRRSAGIDDILTRDPATSLQVVLGLGPGADTKEQLEGAGMKRLVEQLRERFDVVILDAPPALTTPDAARIGSVVDAVLFLVRWESTPQEAVLAALQKLALCGVPVPALILNQVERRAHQSYDASRAGFRERGLTKSSLGRFADMADRAGAQIREA
ncbi:GumC family protein [Kaistia sp. MMO-174]|uniref:GumC family protein n=1 Tax=Kaistia sp. MMO-174 TaxID=3081256 RepID=UPI003017EDCA